MMRALLCMLVGWMMVFGACSSHAAEQIEIRTVTGTPSVTLPEDESAEPANTAEVAPVDPVDSDDALPPPEPSLFVNTLKVLATEPSEARPATGEAEKLTREIRQRRREERDRRDMEKKMSLIRFRLRRQFYQNEMWYQDAIDEEVEYVRNGEDHFDDREYGDAKDFYLDAIAITYPQWIFADETVTIIQTDSGWYQRENFKPSFEKRIFHLSTEYTRLALTRLAIIDRLIAEHDLITARLKADTAYETGNLGKAYRLYTQALEIARRVRRSTFAERYIEDVMVMRESLFAEAALPLGMAEAALASSRPAAALAAMEVFKDKYAEFAFIPELKERYLALEQDPMIAHERREQSALRKIAIGDAAGAREDYRTAVRWYRRAAATHAGTEGAKLAAQKRDALLADPAVVEIIAQQEMAHVSKAMTARAETFASWGKVAEAIEVYDELIDAYPDTTWAEQAWAARKALEVLEQERPTAPVEPPPTKD